MSYELAADFFVKIAQKIGRQPSMASGGLWERPCDRPVHIHIYHKLSAKNPVFYTNPKKILSAKFTGVRLVLDNLKIVKILVDLP